MDSKRMLLNFRSSNSSWHPSGRIPSKSTRSHIIFWVPKCTPQVDPNPIQPNQRLQQTQRENSQIQSGVTETSAPSHRCHDLQRHSSNAVVEQSQSTDHTTSERRTYNHPFHDRQPIVQMGDCISGTLSQGTHNSPASVMHA